MRTLLALILFAATLSTILNAHCSMKARELAISVEHRLRTIFILFDDAEEDPMKLVIVGTFVDGDGDRQTVVIETVRDIEGGETYADFEARHAAKMDEVAAVHPAVMWSAP